MSAEKLRHEEIAEIIRERITSGELKPRLRIPSHVEFADEFGVSISTVSRAIASLRERNYVWTLPHKGSYARPPEHWRKGGEMSSPEELQRSVEEFVEMLDRMRFTGASQVAEVQQLKILIEKYPVQTRYFLDCRCQPASADRGAGSRTGRHRS